MADWGSVMDSGQRAVDLGSVTGTSTGTVVTASASANTKGSWVQFSASTPFASPWMLIAVASSAGGMIDVGTGAAASEQVVIPNLYIGQPIGANTRLLSIPCAIKDGVRVAIRAQSATASATFTIVLLLLA
jgi:hypothetical protein